jgi:carboxyl-terminal processing protease
VNKRILKTVGLLGILFALLVSNFNNSSLTDIQVKSAERYWLETGLDSRELEGLLADNSCHFEKKIFLACVNAVNSMAEKFNLVLSNQGELIPIDHPEKRTGSEKSNLKDWEVLATVNSNRNIPFLKIWRILDTKYIQSEARPSVIAAGINGFLSVYKDPHTYILPIAQYEEVISNSDARQDKVGIVFRKLQSRVFIKKVFETSPAEIAGLKKSDEILSINGQLVAKLLPKQISERLRLVETRRLPLVIIRKEKGATVKKYVEIIRSESVYPSVTSKVINGRQRLGLINLHKFAKDSCKHAREQLVSLIESDIRGVLIDVRDNPGGQLEEASCIAGLFVKKGSLLFETRYLDPLKIGDSYYSEKEPIYGGPLAVLIDSGSASASEILAGALKDLGRAVLVGERSFGKGSFQDGNVWAANRKIAMFQTEGLFYFPSGWTPQLIGLEPDVPVDFNNNENQREMDLYYNPVRPKDRWTGPQTISWLNQVRCPEGLAELESPFEGVPDLVEQDAQIREARAWLICHGAKGSSAKNQKSAEVR